MIDMSKIDELKTKVESLKQKGTILKVKDLEGQGFLVAVSATSVVNGQYGEQLLIVGQWEDGELDVEGEVRLYLNGARRTRFEEAWKGPGLYGFVFGSSVQLKSGYDYIPLELVEAAF
jgi:hypothetical protein